MSKSLFVSFAGNNRDVVDKVEKWNEKGLLGEGYTVSKERGDFRPEGQNAVNRELNNLVNGADKVLVVVGNDTHNRTGVNYEIKRAQQLNKEIIVARINGTTGGLPESLKKHEEISFDPSSIKKKLAE